MSYLDSENDKTGFETVPAGAYQVMIEKIEMQQSSKKEKGEAEKGELISVQFDILNDAHAGRKLFERFNVSNDNPKAQQIGRGQFSQLCKAAGIVLKIDEPKDKNGTVINDWDTRKTYFDATLNAQLKDKVLVANVVLEHDTYRNDDVNVIKKFLTKETPLGQAAGTKKDETPFG